MRFSQLSFNRLPEPIHMRIYTRVPTKWILIDSETGQVYKGNDKGYWDRLSNENKEPNIIPPDFPSHQ